MELPGEVRARVAPPESDSVEEKDRTPVPVWVKVPPIRTTGAVGRLEAPRDPPVTVMPPVKLLFPVRRTVPDPMPSDPLPEIAPERVNVEDPARMFSR